MERAYAKSTFLDGCLAGAEYRITLSWNPIEKQHYKHASQCSANQSNVKINVL